jgi:GNAT superfamily N-acetyltransferase
VSVRIREAQRGDLPALIEMYAELSLDEPREDPSATARYEAAFAAIEALPSHHVLVAEEDGRLLGSVTVIVKPNLTYRGTPFALIENVVVTEAARGQGVGALLIRAAIEIAREAGCYRVSLTSNKRRGEAHRFYERLGFKATHEGFQLRFPG